MLDPSAAAAGAESVAGAARHERRRDVGDDRRLPARLHLPARPALRLDRRGPGYAIGAGFQLALSCDLRVVADDAQFCMKESALGLVPDLTGTKPLVESVGYARALEICATARMVGAAEAVDIGLALAAVPADELDATVADLVGRPDRTAGRRGRVRPRRCCRARRARPGRPAPPGAGGPDPAVPRAGRADGPVGRRARRRSTRCRGCTGTGPAWRHMRRTAASVNNRIERGTVRRVFGFARPHRRLIAVFLALTVIDAALVVVTPLLVQRIVDDGILDGRHRPGHRARARDGRASRSSAPCSRSAAAGSPRGSARA